MARKSRGAKIGGRFCALPHSVIHTREFVDLSGSSTKLLILMFAQFSGGNNGRLVAVADYLGPLGWKSKSMTKKCLDELTATGLLVQTRYGHKNKAAWFAIGWLPLDVTLGLECVSAATYRRFVGSAIAPLAGQSKVPNAPKVRASVARFAPTSGSVKAKTAKSLPSHQGTSKSIAISRTEGNNTMEETKERTTQAARAVAEIGRAPEAEPIELHNAHVQAWVEHLRADRDGHAQQKHWQ
jgi:hypothetical protein